MDAAPEVTDPPSKPTDQGEQEQEQQKQSPTWVSNIDEKTEKDERAQPWKTLLGDEVADRTVLAYRAWDESDQQKDLLKTPTSTSREGSPSSGAPTCDTNGTGTFAG